MSEEDVGEIETETIDYWKVPKFEQKDNPYPVLEKSKFSFLFPKYREQYFKKFWSVIKNEIDNHGIKCKIDFIKGSIEVSTTSKMWDPYMIIKARDMMKLIARSVPLEKAKNILNDGILCELVNLNTKRLKKERLIKRRARLIGPNGDTIKSIEILCGCSIHIQGNTAAVIGSSISLKRVKTIIDDTMSNIHPIYNIKALMIKHELAQDENMKSENWDRYIPRYKNKRISKKVKKFKKRNTEAFPPPPVPSKIDLELETGEYFLKQHEKRSKKLQNRLENQKNKSKDKMIETNQIYQPPIERDFLKEPHADTTFSLEKIKNNMKKIKSKNFKS